MSAARNGEDLQPKRDNDGLVAAYADYLAARPTHTRIAYLRDLCALQALAGDAPLQRVDAAQLRRFLAKLHAGGLSGRSLARILSGWRAFFRFVIEREPFDAFLGGRVAERVDDAFERVAGHLAQSRC